MGFGVGRVPRDVDPAGEALAGLEAERIQPSPRQTRRCQRCGRATSELMTSSCGSVCPDCYDAASDEADY